MDASMPTGPTSDENEPIQIGDELPVKIDTLMVGGERPSVGDDVEVKVSGTVSRIIDDCCYVKLETANDEPIETPQGDQEEQQDLDQQSAMADQQGIPVGGMTTPGSGY
jgi:hypothetical protein